LSSRWAKRGKPGWAAIIPIYNIIVLLQIVGRPISWILLLLIPVVNVVVGFLLALGLFLLGFIFYRGPAAAE
jgi:hypothetical protein